MGPLKIIDSCEQYNMVSAWMEYLCIHRTDKGTWLIDIRGYEVLGETSEYEDEDGNLPDEIDGYEVVGTEDEYVVVNNLVEHSDSYPTYEFNKFDAEKFLDLFSSDSPEWCHDSTITGIREAILNYGK